jgi:nitrate reductase gamma subunit
LLLSARWGRPYPYKRAEWVGVLLALVATPALVYELLFDRSNTSSSLAIAFGIAFGATAVVGWTLLVLGRRAHFRAEGLSSS